MAAGNTYVAIAEQTLGTAAASVTFSSIPGTYTDLRLVIQATVSTFTSGYASLQYNSDTGTNYSYVVMQGNGTSALSTYGTNVNRLYLNNNGAAFNSTTNPVQWTVDIMNYSNATTNKTTLTRFSSSYYSTDTIVGLWRSTAAISTIKVENPNASFAIGSTFSLYGIASA
jgi:hypothetical protein